ncbi:hypothetical protein EVAR_86906_1 [Eumeta japonica]|uniref:Uncharacterized protein n=1 Tax=Eumeta variegata TaxID=151549 RepID=A0A4C1W943_EUMVA|nr:hypothetical protein EVAR_86906_1 [Eumeta japonica]
MDLATREANELLLKGKEALECRQHEARGRTHQHAQELVRIERAHNKDLTNVVKTLTEELSQARRRPKSLDETKSIRDWLGYETEESKETNKDVKKRLLDIETSKGNKDGEIKTKVESVTPSTKKMETDIKTLSAQLDELRTKWGL